MTEYFSAYSALLISEAEEKIRPRPGHAYIAPGGYHLLIERDCSFSLSIDAPVQYSRPSIDVVFESAAACYQNRLIGVLLSGANADGAQGIQTIQEHGGMTLVQDPQAASAPRMPAAALARIKPDLVIEGHDLATHLCNIFGIAMPDSPTAAD